MRTNSYLLDTSMIERLTTDESDALAIGLDHL
jgi:hypothetical protein